MSVLLMAAIAATGLALDQDVERESYVLDIQISAIDIQIPAIDLDRFNIRIPGFAIRVPEYSFEMSGFDFYFDRLELDLSGFEVEIPAIGHGFRHRNEEHDWTSVFEVDMDTTFDVDPNARLEIRNHAGDVVVRTWDRNAVRIEAEHSARDKVKVFESGKVIRVKSESRRGPPDIVDYRLTIPASMALDIWGVYTDVSVDGTRGGIVIETLEGDVRIRNSEGEISVRSVEGMIEVSSTSGRLELNSVDGDIVLQNVGGTLQAESIDGDIRMDGIDSDDVDVRTVDGDISYNGSIRDNGRYRLTTHDGDVVLAMPSGVNATIDVATFDGEFETNFEVEITRAEAGQRFSFTIGDGSAKIELHAFDGDIQLVRQ